jgi:hypothetical protein
MTGKRNNFYFHMEQNGIRDSKNRLYLNKKKSTNTFLSISLFKKNKTNV